jgi:hypothetical protein
MTPNSIIDTTPGVRRVLARIWSRSSSRPLPFDGRGDLELLLYSFMQPKKSANVAEIIEGAGGTLYDPASFLVRQADALTARLRASSITRVDQMPKIPCIAGLVLQNETRVVYATLGLTKSLTRLVGSL